MDIQQLPPGDPAFIEAIVGQLKSKGIFDKCRKECLADVDTKPAFLNLCQRVDSQVKRFLGRQSVKREQNKNQLRERVRKSIQDSGILDTGIDAIINQVVNPKVKPLILPLLEETVCNYLKVEKPSQDENSKAEKDFGVQPTQPYVPPLMLLDQIPPFYGGQFPPQPMPPPVPHPSLQSVPQQVPPPVPPPKAYYQQPLMDHYAPYQEQHHFFPPQHHMGYPRPPMPVQFEHPPLPPNPPEPEPTAVLEREMPLDMEYQHEEMYQNRFHDTPDIGDMPHLPPPMGVDLNSPPPRPSRGGHTPQFSPNVQGRRRNFDSPRYRQSDHKWSPKGFEKKGSTDYIDPADRYYDKVNSENAVDGFEAARKHTDSMSAAIKKLSLKDHANSTGNFGGSDSTGGFGASNVDSGSNMIPICDRSLDSISSNTSGLSLSADENKREKEVTVRSDVSTPLADEKSTPLADEKRNVGMESVSSDESNKNWDYSPKEDREPEKVADPRKIEGMSPISDSTAFGSSCDERLDTQKMENKRRAGKSEGELSTSSFDAVTPSPLPSTTPPPAPPIEEPKLTGSGRTSALEEHNQNELISDISSEVEKASDDSDSKKLDDHYQYKNKDEHFKKDDDSDSDRKKTTDDTFHRTSAESIKKSETTAKSSDSVATGSSNKTSENSDKTATSDLETSNKNTTDKTLETRDKKLENTSKASETIAKGTKDVNQSSVAKKPIETTDKFKSKTSETKDKQKKLNSEDNKKSHHSRSKSRDRRHSRDDSKHRHKSSDRHRDKYKDSKHRDEKDRHRSDKHRHSESSKHRHSESDKHRRHDSDRHKERHRDSKSDDRHKKDRDRKSSKHSSSSKSSENKKLKEIDLFDMHLSNTTKDVKLPNPVMKPSNPLATAQGKHDLKEPEGPPIPLAKVEKKNSGTKVSKEVKTVEKENNKETDRDRIKAMKREAIRDRIREMKKERNEGKENLLKQKLSEKLNSTTNKSENNLKVNEMLDSCSAPEADKSRGKSLSHAEEKSEKRLRLLVEKALSRKNKKKLQNKIDEKQKNVKSLTTNKAEKFSKNSLNTTPNEKVKKDTPKSNTKKGLNSDDILKELTSDAKKKLNLIDYVSSDSSLGSDSSESDSEAARKSSKTKKTLKITSSSESSDEDETGIKRLPVNRNSLEKKKTNAKIAVQGKRKVETKNVSKISSSSESSEDETGIKRLPVNRNSLKEKKTNAKIAVQGKRKVETKNVSKISSSSESSEDETGIKRLPVNRNSLEEKKTNAKIAVQGKRKVETKSVSKISSSSESSDDEFALSSLKKELVPNKSKQKLKKLSPNSTISSKKKVPRAKKLTAKMKQALEESSSLNSSEKEELRSSEIQSSEEPASDRVTISLLNLKEDAEQKGIKTTKKTSSAKTKSKKQLGKLVNKEVTPGSESPENISNNNLGENIIMTSESELDFEGYGEEDRLPKVMVPRIVLEKMPKAMLDKVTGSANKIVQEKQVETSSDMDDRNVIEKRKIDTKNAKQVIEKQEVETENDKNILVKQKVATKNDKNVIEKREVRIEEASNDKDLLAKEETGMKNLPVNRNSLEEKKSNAKAAVQGKRKVETKNVMNEDVLIKKKRGRKKKVQNDKNVVEERNLETRDVKYSLDLDDLFDSSNDELEFEGFSLVLSPRKSKKNKFVQKGPKGKSLQGPQRRGLKRKSSGSVSDKESKGDSSDMELSLAAFCKTKTIPDPPSKGRCRTTSSDFEGFGVLEVGRRSENYRKTLVLSELLQDSEESKSDESSEAVRTFFSSKNVTKMSIIEQIAAKKLQLSNARKKNEILQNKENTNSGNSSETDEILLNPFTENFLDKRLESPLRQTRSPRATSESDSRRPLKKRKLSNLQTDSSKLSDDNFSRSRRGRKDVIVNSYAFLTPEDDRNSREYEVDLSAEAEREGSYSPLSPASEFSATEVQKSVL